MLTLQRREKRSVFSAQLRFFEHIGSAAVGALKALFPAPLLDVRMVTREQNGRHLFAVPFDRAGILRIFEQGRKMALELECILVSEHSWEHTRDGIRKHKRGQLATGDNKIAY